MTPKIQEYVEAIACFRNGSLPRGATRKEILLAEQAIRIPFPEQLSEWLRFCNGTRNLLPAAYFGVGSLAGDQSLDATYIMFERFPEFANLCWFPIASDGCGSFWVMPLRGDRHPIIFVDHEDGMDKGSYVAGSDLDHFLEMILERQILHDRDFDWSDRWPGDEDFVRARDPNIGPYDGVLPMWDADMKK